MRIRWKYFPYYYPFLKEITSEFPSQRYMFFEHAVEQPVDLPVI